MRRVPEDNFALFTRRALSGKENSWWLQLLYPVRRPRGPAQGDGLLRWMLRLFGA